VIENSKTREVDDLNLFAIDEQCLNDEVPADFPEVVPEVIPEIVYRVLINDLLHFKTLANYSKINVWESGSGMSYTIQVFNALKLAKQLSKIEKCKLSHLFRFHMEIDFTVVVL
jgi:hypothetical protein